MKPFDLEAAKRGEPIMTRDGGRAVFIGMAPEDFGVDQPVVAWVEGFEEPGKHFTDGRYYKNEESDIDLFMAPRKHKRWLIVYRNVSLGGQIEADLCSSETDCNTATDKLRDKGHTILSSGQRIEWEE